MKEKLKNIGLHILNFFKNLCWRLVAVSLIFLFCVLGANIVYYLMVLFNVCISIFIGDPLNNWNLEVIYIAFMIVLIDFVLQYFRKGVKFIWDKVKSFDIWLTNKIHKQNNIEKQTFTSKSDGFVKIISDKNDVDKIIIKDDKK